MEDYPKNYVLFDSQDIKGMSSSEIRNVIKLSGAWDKHERTQ